MYFQLIRTFFGGAMVKRFPLPQLVFFMKNNTFLSVFNMYINKNQKKGIIILLNY